MRPNRRSSFLEDRRMGNSVPNRRRSFPFGLKALLLVMKVASLAGALAAYNRVRVGGPIIAIAWRRCTPSIPRRSHKPETPRTKSRAGFPASRPNRPATMWNIQTTSAAEKKTCQIKPEPIGARRKAEVIKPAERQQARSDISAITMTNAN